MKKYEKPMLISMELAGNEQLCGSCANRGALLLKDNPGVAFQIIDFNGDPNRNGKPDRSDFTSSVLFGIQENCTKGIELYCKFTGSSVVAWS